MPWWFSLAATVRVPNRIANTASSAAVISALSSSGQGWWASGTASTCSENAAAFSCSARYGRIPITAISATSAASSWRRP